MKKNLLERVEIEKNLYDNAFLAAVDHLKMAHSHLFEEFEGRDMFNLLTNINNTIKQIELSGEIDKITVSYNNPCGEVYLNEHLIKGCYHECTFFGTNSDGMYCSNPHWKDKGAYKNMIITHNNSKDGNIPEKCPLRKENSTIINIFSVKENFNEK